jgi:peptidoglycan L-alanyl-D-glutamate endopeptidase CwlK
MSEFSEYSKKRLRTCHTDLQEVLMEVIKHRDCRVLSGHRGEAEQEALVAEGRSQLPFPRSRHNSYPSEAVDVVPYPIDWDDIPRFQEFMGFVLGVAAAKGVGLEAGGHWKTFRDYPHYQLKKK